MIRYLHRIIWFSHLVSKFSFSQRRNFQNLLCIFYISLCGFIYLNKFHVHFYYICAKLSIVLLPTFQFLFYILYNLNRYCNNKQDMCEWFKGLLLSGFATSDAIQINTVNTELIRNGSEWIKTTVFVVVVAKDGTKYKYHTHSLWAHPISCLAISN